MSEKRTVSYYLPGEAADYIETQAKKENRSPSNWLATTLLNLMGGKTDENT